MAFVLSEYTLQIFNLSICFMSFFLFAITCCMKKPPLDILPKSLRAFIKLSLPIFFIFPLGSIITTVLSFTNCAKIFYDIINVFQSFAGNFARIAFSLICTERFLAITYLHTFERFTIKRIGISMFGLSLILAFLLTIPYSFVNDYGIIDLYIILSTHLIASFFCLQMLSKYTNLHQSILFNPSLKGRYTIIENIRILRKLKFYILIVLFFAPIPPFIIFLLFIMTGETPFLPIIYTGYNMCFMCSLFWRIFQIRYHRKVAQAKVIVENVQTVDTAADVENVI